MSTLVNYVQKKWRAKKASPFKLIKWNVGEEYNSVYVRPQMEEGKRIMQVTFEPAKKVKGLREQMVIPEDVFLECFESC